MPSIEPFGFPYLREGFLGLSYCFVRKVQLTRVMFASGGAFSGESGSLGLDRFWAGARFARLELFDYIKSASCLALPPNSYIPGIRQLAVKSSQLTVLVK